MCWSNLCLKSELKMFEVGSGTLRMRRIMMLITTFDDDDVHDGDDDDDSWK